MKNNKATESMTEKLNPILKIQQLLDMLKFPDSIAGSKHSVNDDKKSPENKV